MLVGIRVIKLWELVFLVFLIGVSNFVGEVKGG